MSKAISPSELTRHEKKTRQKIHSVFNYNFDKICVSCNKIFLLFYYYLVFLFTFGFTPICPPSNHVCMEFVVSTVSRRKHVYVIERHECPLVRWPSIVVVVTARQSGNFAPVHARAFCCRMTIVVFPFRRHVAVDELRHNSVHRVQRHPPGLGRAHLANTIPDSGQRRHRSAAARATHDESGVQRGDGGDVASQSQAVADVDDVSGRAL